ncbi:MAG: tyrosine-type recombinase/integrase [Treponema sp.]|nr:tyrosine-type recombinase/integrase [Treponema sp.]
MEPFPGAVTAPGVKGVPSFSDITLGGLTGDIIRSWMLWLGEKGVSGRRINQCLQTMRVAVRDALERERLETDPFKRIHEAPEEGREKGVLSPAEVARYITSNSQDCYARLAVLLGALCGMRRGEIRGLQWGDIREGVIVIRHNFVNGDGLKNPKRKGGMVRENSRAVPLPRAVAEALTVVYQRAQYREPGDYVIQSLRRRNTPVSESYFKHALLREMDGIGISPDEQKRRNLTPHSLRHVFVTLGRLAGISDLEIQARAGHRAGAMMERYSHAAQVLDFTAAREKLEKVMGEA